MLFLENKEEVLDIHVWTHENRHLMTEHNVQPTPEFEALVQKISNTYKLG